MTRIYCDRCDRCITSAEVVHVRLDYGANGKVYELCAVCARAIADAFKPLPKDGAAQGYLSEGYLSVPIVRT